MRPFILKSVEFDHKKMEVTAYTDCGILKFPVRPPLKNQKESYIIVFENGKYLIRTVDYNRLRRGDYGIYEEIKLFHEVGHCDKRAVSPIYSTGKVIQKYIKNYELFQMLENAGLKLLLRMENTVEDLFTIPILEELGYSNVRDVIQIEKHITELGRVFSGDKKFSSKFQDFLLEKATKFEKRIKVVYALYDILDGLILSRIIKRSKEPSLLRKLINKFWYSPFDWIANRYDIEKGRKIYSKCLQYSVEQENLEIDPLIKYRWNLEVKRLKKNFKSVLPGLQHIDVVNWSIPLCDYLEKLQGE